jgi:hypothetical protein
MFLDLTMPEVNMRLLYVIYKTTMGSFPGGHSVQQDQSDKTEEEIMEEEYSRQNFYTNFRKEIFTELTKTLEAKQCAQSIFI